MRPLARFTMGLGVVLCAAVGAALAQPRPHGGVETYGQPAATPFDRDSLHPTPVTLYGLFNAGWARLDASRTLTRVGLLWRQPIQVLIRLNAVASG